MHQYSETKLITFMVSEIGATFSVQCNDACLDGKLWLPSSMLHGCVPPDRWLSFSVLPFSDLSSEGQYTNTS